MRCISQIIAHSSVGLTAKRHQLSLEYDIVFDNYYSIAHFKALVKPFFQKTENFFISSGGSVVSPAFLCISHNGFDISTWICGNLLPQPECFKEKT